MSYKITVLKSEVTKQPKGYSVAELAYKSDDGKTKGMKVLDFLQKEVFIVASQAKPGDVLDADFEKNAKGFWTFKSLTATGLRADTTPSTGGVSSPTPTKSAGGNWETSQERAARQVMIVRQSSISNAIGVLTANKAKFDAYDVIATAEVFEAFVLGTVIPTGEVE